MISNDVIDLLKFLSLLILHGRLPARWIYHIFTYFDNSTSAYATLQASTFFSFVLLRRSKFQKESEAMQVLFRYPSLVCRENFHMRDVLSGDESRCRWLIILLRKVPVPTVWG